MRILYLGPDSQLVQFLQGLGNEVVRMEEAITAEFVAGEEFNFLISYSYRHILSEGVLTLFGGRAINLHISFLPWNRGADPNFWSWLEATPKGVSIHLLDAKVDAGDILFQKEILESDFGENPTLSSSYSLLHCEMQKLFQVKWEEIRTGQCQRIKQEGFGSVHLKRQREQLEHLLTEGWNTPVSLLVKYGKELRKSQPPL